MDPLRISPADLTVFSLPGSEGFRTHFNFQVRIE